MRGAIAETYVTHHEVIPSSVMVLRLLGIGNVSVFTSGKNLYGIESVAVSMSWRNGGGEDTQ